ncbi:acetyl-CoA C-acyltransferase FadI [Aquirhabdus parva]|uniref:Acetyl-CoA C-acyltransferase FadI n=1 Tax=Aquirhabdus parva TaxID=2283318 RepID=A0A345PA23_9GAMM|nr:acetyl-CoA C-acyltransferase FadI [Aquirhabdus parva]AXI04132.1 acetyl-CoA C-acyltransferase FadI [Aquirhabdus parva]
MSSTVNLSNQNGRIAIVDGVRTPFARIATHYRDLSAIDLGSFVVNELIKRNDLKPKQIDQLVFGMTVMIPEAPFIAREVALACGLDDVDAYSITRACATSFQTIASAAESILAGNAEIVIAGGTDSTSSVRLPMSQKFSSTLRDVNFAKTFKDRVRLLSSLRPKDILPLEPSITEFSVGETMGQSCEKMVKKWGVSRAEQDDLAYASHHNAARAWKDGYLDDQVMSVALGNGKTLKDDNLVRKNPERSAYDKLKPCFDFSGAGSVTAGNASSLTDGASAVLLMSEAKAKALGLEPIGYIRSFAFAAKTPKDDLLMGPVLAAPIALDRAGITLQELSLVDMHEAFAGQLACNLKGLESLDYARTTLNRTKAVGEVDRKILNVNGGSIAFGHPFGATGARVVSQALYELKRRGGGIALTTACAAGGIGAAMVVEAD